MAGKFAYDDDDYELIFQKLPHCTGILHTVP